jgi:hypothetical protein
VLPGLVLNFGLLSFYCSPPADGMSRGCGLDRSGSTISAFYRVNKRGCMVR